MGVGGDDSPVVGEADDAGWGSKGEWPAAMALASVGLGEEMARGGMEGAGAGDEVRVEVGRGLVWVVSRPGVKGETSREERGRVRDMSPE